ncbi:3'-5' exonuclease, partial [Candidatus Peregrinibacteria bacterium]|nr:3'-5' exonuclease [Candidatus Peregrinibacteria bacterium]
MPLPPLTVFDVETTGLDPKKGHRIVELAGVRIEGGKIIEEQMFHSLINPERDIPPEVRQIHGISQSDVVGAPTVMTVLPQFLSFAAGSILVAHNAAFDKGFLESEKEFCWGYPELPSFLCTMRLSQSLYPTAYGHNLDAVCQRLQIAMQPGRHRAQTDVMLTGQAL